jgi:PAS domain S-box-containing protein
MAPNHLNQDHSLAEHDQAVEALRQSEGRFRKLVEQAPLAMAVVSMDGVIEFINQRAVKDFGYLPEDIPNMDRWWAQAYPDEAYRRQVIADWTGRIEKALSEKQDIVGNEYRVTCKDGTQKICFISGVPVSEKILVLFDDISERKRMQEALHESEKRYKMVSELVTDYVYRLDIAADGKVTMDFVSDNFYSLTGRTREDILTIESWSSFVHPDDLGEVMGLLQRLSATPQSAELECRSYVHGRNLRWVSVIAKSEWDDQKRRVTGIVGAVKDITERKKAQESTAAEKERLAVTLRSIGDGVITTDINGRIDIMNEAAEELTGWNWGDAQGRPLESIFTIVNTETRQACASPFASVVSTGGIVELADHALLVMRDGTERLIANSGAPIRDGSGKTVGVVVVFRDVTEKQKIADTIQRSAKLDSLGVLAGGIAHDFNNLLTGIFGYIDLARSKSDNAETIDYLDATIASINRARALTLQLLTFAKGGAPIQKVTPLVPFVQEAVQFALSGSNVACKFCFAENLWACNIDKNQISQVIDNVVINAQQAMPSGGAIEVTATNVSSGEVDIPGLASGDYVRVSIRDFGIGIPKDIISRIFDPFFTTKTKGHGLGLATCYSIINRHGGCIDVESEPGKGSVFHIYLPVATAPAIARQASTSHRTGSGTIIVVDDEEVIRTTVRRMLELLGYAAVCKKDGREAIDFYLSETHQGRSYAAIIIDLTIPGGMSGIESAAEIRKFDEKIPMFVASGYADDSVMRSPSEYGFTASLRKPFTIAELSEMLSGHLKT